MLERRGQGDFEMEKSIGQLVSTAVQRALSQLLSDPQKVAELSSMVEATVMETIPLAVRETVVSMVRESVEKENRQEVNV